MSIAFFSLSFLVFTQTASAAPPRCFNHDGTQNATCQNIGVQLSDDKCYTESRGGPNGTLLGYNETSCADATDRDQDGNPGGARATTEAPSPTYVRNDCTERPMSKDNCGIIGYIVMFINILSGLAGVVIVASMIVGGIQYSSAGSDPQKVSSAKSRIRNAIIALLLFLFGYGLLNYLVPGGVI